MADTRTGVTVLCSATICKYRVDTGYYGICENKSVVSRYRELLGGHAYVEGCACSHCDKDCSKDCPKKEVK